MISLLLRFEENATIAVNGPILPTIIVAISKYLPKTDSCEVIPVESPTVPNAEAASYNDGKKPKLLLYSSKIVTVTTINNPNAAIVIAFIITSVATRLLKI